MLNRKRMVKSKMPNVKENLLQKEKNLTVLLGKTNKPSKNLKTMS